MRLFLFAVIGGLGVLAGLLVAQFTHRCPELQPGPTTHKAILLQGLQSGFDVPLKDLSLPFEKTEALPATLRRLQKAYSDRTPGIYLIECSDETQTKRIQCLAISPDRTPEFHSMVLHGGPPSPRLVSHASLEVRGVRLNDDASEITVTGPDSEVTLTVYELISFGA